MADERACGAARTIAPGSVAVCDRLPSRHAGLDHRDFHQGVSWPVCESYCPANAQPGDPPERHACGRYRGDTIARYAGG